MFKKAERKKGYPHYWVKKNRQMYCYCCDKETIWNFVLGEVSYNGIKPCLECSICGEIIPAFTIRSYQELGRPIIPE